MQCHYGSRKIYNTLVILLHFMDVIAPRHHWRARLKNLFAEHAIPVAAMGFPEGWQEWTIWRLSTELVIPMVIPESEISSSEENKK